MYKSKIFSGMDADQQFNHWCKEHTNISIMAFRFINAPNPRYFAICIMYMELDLNRTISYTQYPVLDEES